MQDEIARIRTKCKAIEGDMYSRWPKQNINLCYYIIAFSNPLFREDLKILKRHNVLLNIEIKIRGSDKGYPSTVSVVIEIWQDSRVVLVS